MFGEVRLGPIFGHFGLLGAGFAFFAFVFLVPHLEFLGFIFYQKWEGQKHKPNNAYNLLRYY